MFFVLIKLRNNTIGLGFYFFEKQGVILGLNKSDFPLFD